MKNTNRMMQPSHFSNTNRKSQYPLGFSYYLAMTTMALLTVSIAVSASAATGGSSINSGGNTEKLMIMPLIPHHELQRRRLREEQMKGGGGDGQEIESNVFEEGRHLLPKTSIKITHTDAREYSRHNKNNDNRRNLDEDNNNDNNGGGGSTLSVDSLYQGYGTHYADIWLGTTNPQRQTVIVDTGSGVTAFPCEGCNDCGQSYHASPFFDPNKSSTYDLFDCDRCLYRARCNGRGGSKDGKCSLSVSYQEGSSWSAYQAQDWAYLGGYHDDGLPMDEPELENQVEMDEGTLMGSVVHGEDPKEASKFRFPMVFGCQYRITGLFKTQLADGIMGMCNQQGAIWSQMYENQIISHKSFSLCFRRSADADKEGSHAGAMTMGGTDTRLHESPMLYANGFVNKGIMHGITLRKMYLMRGGEEKYLVSDVGTENTVKVDVDEATFASGNTILDSGTTDTYINSAVKNAFNSAFKEMFGLDYRTGGMKISDEMVETLPSIVLQIIGKDDTSQVFDSRNPDALPGLAGPVDNEYPNDILVVLPPAHYMEYNSKKDLYMPRVYFTERSGSVIGANAMAGHDVFFDIKENGRIGFASSDCNYMSFLNRTVYNTEDGTEDNTDIQDNTDSEDSKPDMTDDLDTTDDALDEDEDDYYEDIEEEVEDGVDDEDGSENVQLTQSKNKNAASADPEEGDYQEFDDDDDCDSLYCEFAIHIKVVAVAGLLLAFAAYKKSRASSVELYNHTVVADDLDLDEEIERQGYRDDVNEKATEIELPAKV